MGRERQICVPELAKLTNVANSGTKKPQKSQIIINVFDLFKQKTKSFVWTFLKISV